MQKDKCCKLFDLWAPEEALDSALGNKGRGDDGGLRADASYTT